MEGRCERESCCCPEDCRRQHSVRETCFQDGRFEGCMCSIVIDGDDGPRFPHLANGPKKVGAYETRDRDAVQPISPSPRPKFPLS